MVAQEVLYSMLLGYYEPLLQIEKQADGSLNVIILSKLRENLQDHEVFLISDVFASFCYNVRMVHVFIETRTTYTQVYANILQKNLRIFLQEYTEFILTNLKDPNSCLLTNVQINLSEYIVFFKNIESIINSSHIQESSCRLIDRIVKLASITFGLSKRNFSKILHSMYHQFLSDTYFAIFKKKFNSEYILDIFDEKLQINENQIPDFIDSQFIEKLIFIINYIDHYTDESFLEQTKNKFLNFLSSHSRECDIFNQDLEDSFTQVLDISDLRNHLNDIFKHIEGSLWNKIIEEEKLFDILDLLLDVCTLRRGDIFMTLLKNISEQSNYIFDNAQDTEQMSNILRLPMNDITGIESSVNFFIDDAFQKTMMTVFPSKIQTVQRINSENPLTFSIRINQDFDNNNNENSNDILVIDQIKLRIMLGEKISKNLDTIFNKNTLEIFSNFFRTFLKIHMSSNSLRENYTDFLDLEKSLKRKKSKSEDIDAKLFLKLKTIAILYSNMCLFINHFFDYIYNDIIDCQLLKFYKTTNQDRTIMSLELGIEMLLRKIKTLSFMDNEQLLETFHKILNDMKSLKELWTDKIEKLPEMEEIQNVQNSFRFNVLRFLRQLNTTTKMTQDLEVFPNCSYQALGNRLNYFDKLFNTPSI